MEHLATILKRLQEVGLTLKAKKCHISLQEVNYLSHQVGKIQLLQAKFEAIQEYPRLQTKKHIQSFWGLTGDYCRFVSHYSNIAAP